VSDKTRKRRAGSKVIENESHPVVFIKGGKIRASTIYELTSSMDLSDLEKPTVAQSFQEFYENDKLITILTRSRLLIHMPGHMNTVRNLIQFFYESF
jgi:hypothetical protein